MDVSTSPLPARLWQLDALRGLALLNLFVTRAM